MSKLVVYRRFGGKEGLCAVVVDREINDLLEPVDLHAALPSEHPRELVDQTTLALLTYVEEQTPTASGSYIANRQ